MTDAGNLLYIVRILGHRIRRIEEHLGLACEGHLWVRIGKQPPACAYCGAHPEGEGEAVTNKRRRRPFVTSRRRKAVAVAFFAAILAAVFVCTGGVLLAPHRAETHPILSKLAFGVIGYCVGYTANRHVIAPAWARIIRPAFNQPEEEETR